MAMFMATKTPAHQLDNYLKGMYMGIDAFNNLIEKCNNPSLKSILCEVVQNYTSHASTLSNRILDLGETPSEGVGLAGKFSEIFNNIKNITINSDSEILQLAYENCKTGVIMGQKFLQENSKYLDEVSLNLITNMLHEDEKYLQKLDEFKH